MYKNELLELYLQAQRTHLTPYLLCTQYLDAVTVKLINN